jgi:hypothetical protein
MLKVGVCFLIKEKYQELTHSKDVWQTFGNRSLRELADLSTGA